MRWRCCVGLRWRRRRLERSGIGGVALPHRARPRVAVFGHQVTLSARDCLPPSCRSFWAANPLLRAAYGVTVSLSSYLPRSLATDRGAGSKSRAALRSSLRRLRAVLAQVQNNERVLPSATVPGRIVQASRGAAQMTATPCRMGEPAPLSRQVPEPAARPQCAASGRRAPERRD